MRRFFHLLLLLMLVPNMLLCCGGSRPAGLMDKYVAAGFADESAHPDTYITRGQFAEILSKIMHYPVPEHHGYLDADEYQNSGILAAAHAGIIRGDDLYLRPNDNLTRQEAVTILSRVFHFNQHAKYPLYFLDSHLIAPWAQNNVAYMYGRGFVNGSKGYFRPTDTITYAESLQVIENIAKIVYNVSGNYSSQHIEGGAIISAPVELYDSVIDGDVYISAATAAAVTLHNTVIKGRIVNMSAYEVLLTGGSTVGAQESIDYYGHALPVLHGVPGLRHDSSAFGRDDRGYATYDGAETLLGVDVSAWQKDINWSAVKAAGIDFAMLRVGYRGYSNGKIHSDPYFVKNIEGVAKNGIQAGVYFFSQATSVKEAEAEADYVLERIKGHNITMPVVFDWELIDYSTARTDKVTGGQATEYALAFLNKIKAAGYDAYIYLYPQTAYFHFDLRRLTDFKVWVAHYKDNPEYYYDFDIWQFTSSGKVPGINGNVDLNLMIK